MNETSWIIIYDEGILTRKDLALSDLGGFEYSIFLVKTSEQTLFVYEPIKGRCHVFLDSGPITLPISGQPFFYWKNKVTLAIDGELVNKSRILSFGIVNKIVIEEKDYGYEVSIYEQD